MWHPHSACGDKHQQPRCLRLSGCNKTACHAHLGHKVVVGTVWWRHLSKEHSTAGGSLNTHRGVAKTYTQLCLMHCSVGREHTHDASVQAHVSQLEEAGCCPHRKALPASGPGQRRGRLVACVCRCLHMSMRSDYRLDEQETAWLPSLSVGSHLVPT